LQKMVFGAKNGITLDSNNPLWPFRKKQ